MNTSLPRVCRRVVFLLLTLLASCSGRRAPASTAVPPGPVAPTPQAASWPTSGWRTALPSSQGMDGALLDEAVTEAQRERLALNGLLVIRHGYIVKETYFSPWEPGTVHELYSCTKSFTSVLTGIAIRRGYLHGVTDPVMGFFPNRQFPHPDPRKGDMTIESLLSMSSGLVWREDDMTYREMYATARDWVGYVLGQPMQADPGSFFWYSSGNSHVLSSIIEQKSGKGTYAFAQEALFRPLGIRDPEWERDPVGVPIGGWGLKLTPRDMAKLGYLYLRQGTWDGSQIVPSAWVQASTRAHIRATEKLGYGYQWWIDSSAGMYAAIGRYGQGVFVVPSCDLVVVFTAQIDSSDPEFDLIHRFIIPACQPAPVSSS